MHLLGSQRRRGLRLPPLAAAVVVLAALLGTGASADGPLDATIDVHNTTAPDGGIFHVTGRTSCSLTDVTLKYRRYDGDVDIATEQAKTKTRQDGLFDYTIDFIVPFNAEPGPGKLFADPRCGDPNAAPSKEVDVAITKAILTLRATPTRPAPGQVVTVSGDRCYGDDDGHVTIHASGVITGIATADLTQQHFTAKFRASASIGEMTFAVESPDCSGSTSAKTSATVTPPDGVPTTHPPLSSSAASPRSSTTASATPTPTGTVTSAPPAAAAPTVPARTTRRLPVLGLSVVLALIVAVGAAVARWRRRRA